MLSPKGQKEDDRVDEINLRRRESFWLFSVLFLFCSRCCFFFLVCFSADLFILGLTNKRPFGVHFLFFGGFLKQILVFAALFRWRFVAK